MSETREDRQKRIEENSRRIQIRAGIENLHKLPMLSEDAREKIKSGLKDFLPILKDEVKSQIANMSERMGIGADRKTYVMKNGKEGLEIWTMQNMRAFDGDIVSKFSFQRVIDRIDKYTNPASLIADALTGRLFGDEEYVIDEGNTAEENIEAQKKLEEATNNQNQQPK